jgi:hypothetical protein
MSVESETFKANLIACLGQDEGVTALQACIAGHFPDFEVFRENEDLIIRDASRFLIVRRTAADRFRTQSYVSVPSTNEVDRGGGVERDVDGLFNELVAFSEV